MSKLLPVVVLVICLCFNLQQFCSADDGAGNCFAKCSVDADCGAAASPGCSNCVGGVCSCGVGLEPCARGGSTVSYGYTPYNCINSTTQSCCGPKGESVIEFYRSPFVGFVTCAKGEQCCVGQTSNWYCYNPNTHVCCADQDMRSGLCKKGSSCVYASPSWDDQAYCVNPPDNYVICPIDYKYSDVQTCDLHSKSTCGGGYYGYSSGGGSESMHCLATSLSQCNCPYGTTCVKNNLGQVINCTDIDECASGEVVCGADAVCVNKYAGYVCKPIHRCDKIPSVCPAGYFCYSKIDLAHTDIYNYDGLAYFCQEIDECKSGTACPPNFDCINTQGSYDCVPSSCPSNSSQYRAFDKTCKDCYWNSTQQPLTPLSPLFGGYPNIAFRKQAVQTDTYNGFVASYAVDGNVSTYQQCQRNDMYYYIGDFENTDTSQMHKEWVLNLGVEYVITGINLVPRQDCCNYRFKHYTITIRNIYGERTAVLFAGDQTYNNFTHAFTAGVTGIYIQVEKSLNAFEHGEYTTWDEDDYMHIAEFEVYGYINTTGPAALSACINSNNKNGSSECAPGYAVKGSSGCSDIDECLYDLHNCSRDGNEVCTNTDGSFVCLCAAGYTGSSCSDINECALNTHNCAKGYLCRNTPGSFACDDINECAAAGACPPTLTCSNIVGSYQCTYPASPCATGKYYFSQDNVCLACYYQNVVGPYYFYNTTGQIGFGGHPNIALNKSTSQLNTNQNYIASNAVDHNIATFQASLETGGWSGRVQAYWDLNLGIEYTVYGFNYVPRQDCCIDRFQYTTIQVRNLKNEIIASIAAGGDSVNYNNFTYTFATPVNAIHFRVIYRPQNYAGDLYQMIAEFEVFGTVANPEEALAKCSPVVCGTGFYYNGSKCVDVDECSYPPLYSCAAPQTCLNTNGSYVCACNGTTCAVGGGVCTNASGLLFCSCLPGYSGIACSDINECALNTHNCSKGYQCRNTPGSFACDDVNECATAGACPPTYTCGNTAGSYQCTYPVPPCPAGKYLFSKDNVCLPCYYQNVVGPYYFYDSNGQIGFDGHPNIAINKSTSQLNTNQNYVAGNAVDHNITTFQASLETGGWSGRPQAYWDLNLGIEHTVYGINYVPRQDCCIDRFTYTTIQARNLNNELVKNIYAFGDGVHYKNFTSIFIAPVNIIHFRIIYAPQNYAGDLYQMIAEFEVFGYVANHEEALAKCSPVVCGTGFYYNGSKCIDVDECSYPPLYSCAAPQKCINTNGSYVCGCNPGYNGTNCTDINECANPNACIQGKKCNNTVGSFSCSESKKYFVKSNVTGYVATAGPNAGDNVIVAVKKLSNFTDQLWSFVPGEGGFLQNVATGRVMDIKNGATSAGTNVITWSKKTGYNINQQWGYNASSLVFTSKAATLVLDVEHGSTSPNIPIIVYTPKSPSTNNNQRFELVEYTS